MNSGSLRESRIAEKVDRRMDTWRGDILTADVESPLDDERYDVLVVDFEGNGLTADVVSRPLSRLEEVMREFCAGREKKWSYELSFASELDEIPDYRELEANFIYEDQDDMEKLWDIQEELFGEEFRPENYEITGIEEIRV
mgnify:CR=1 FL=1